MFIDEITLHLKAGRGGDGVVRWRHEKGKDKGGPAGGNGGKGGDVYAVAVRDIGILASYRNVKEFEAGRGRDGFKDLKQGAEGRGVARVSAISSCGISSAPRRFFIAFPRKKVTHSERIEL